MKRIKKKIRKVWHRFCELQLENSWCWRMTGDCSFYTNPIDGHVSDVVEK